MKLIFCMIINIKVFCKLILSFLMGLAKHAQSMPARLHYHFNISGEKLEMNLIFCMQVNIKDF